MGQKNDDYIVPLCFQCHRTGEDAQHNQSEKDFWKAMGYSGHSLALVLKLCFEKNSWNTADIICRSLAMRRAIEAGEYIARSRWNN
jgi:hypothetical protein